MASMAAKEGTRLQQFKASFNAFQFELETQKPSSPTIANQEAVVTRPDDTGLESLVKALQEEAFVIKTELAEWKHKAASVAQENAILKEDLGNTITKLKAEVEGWRDRAAMSAGKGIVARRQLEDFAKQVKALSGELQQWKEVAAERELGSSKLQEENGELIAERNQWMQKAEASAEEAHSLKSELICSMAKLETDLKKWKDIATSGTCDESRVHIEELEDSVRDLRAEVVDWEKVARLEQVVTATGKSEDGVEVRSGNSIGDCDCSSQASERTSNEWRDGPSELEITLQSEIEDLKKKAVCAVKEQEQLKQRYETRVRELQVEVEAWKKRAACNSEDGKLERLDLEKKLLDLQVKVRDATDCIAQERKRSSLEQAELQAEVKDWKVIAADASEECSSLRGAFENVTKELQLELAQWKAKAESGREEGKFVKAELEKVVEDLEKQVLIWKGKAESALEGMAKIQEYADLVQTLDLELCLWKQRTQEGKSLQSQLEEEQERLKVSLTETQNELQKWKDRAAAIARSMEFLQEDSCDVDDEGDGSLRLLESELQKWKTKAQEGELLQLQLKNLLAETQKELYEWKQKAAAVTLATESLKEELDCVIEEGRFEREELYSSMNELEAGLFVWRERAQECQSLQTQVNSSQAELMECKEKLTSSQSELKEWKDKAVAITLTTRSLMEELDFRIEEGLVEKQEFCNSISALKESVLGWKEKAAESDALVLELNSTLLETQTALRDWKDRATSVAMASESMKSDMDGTLEDYRLEREELCNTINELEAEVYEWKARAQDGVTVQQRLERALSELEKKKRPLLRAHKSGSVTRE